MKTRVAARGAGDAVRALLAVLDLEGRVDLELLAH